MQIACQFHEQTPQSPLKLSCKNQSLNITNCLFSSLKNSSPGGALSLESASQATLSTSAFISCSSTQNAGATQFIISSPLTIKCTLYQSCTCSSLGYNTQDRVQSDLFHSNNAFLMGKHGIGNYGIYTDQCKRGVHRFINISSEPDGMEPYTIGSGVAQTTTLEYSNLVSNKADHLLFFNNDDQEMCMTNIVKNKGPSTLLRASSGNKIRFTENIFISNQYEAFKETNIVIEDRENVFFDCVFTSQTLRKPLTHFALQDNPGVKGVCLTWIFSLNKAFGSRTLASSILFGGVMVHLSE